MKFTEKELVFLKAVVTKTLEHVKAEEKTIIEHPTPAFLAAEERYEDFLKNLLRKFP
jgi:hypothetical protein